MNGNALAADLRKQIATEGTNFHSFCVILAFCGKKNYQYIFIL